MIASRHGDFPVKKGDKIAGTRVIPLVIEKEKMDKAKQVAGSEPIFTVIPYVHKKVGIVTTGSEVYEHRIEDAFTPVIEEKLSEYDTEILGHIVCNDDHEMITKAIQTLLKKGCDMIICTGGMSVDPDDRTPLAIRNAGTKIVGYGAPVLPGAMFLLGYFEDGTPVMGLPGCVMYAKSTIFDIMLPRIAAGIPVKAEDFYVLGHGGLCLGCAECRFPDCSFGKV